MFDGESFEVEKIAEIERALTDPELLQKAQNFLIHSDKYKYVHYWVWLGLPIIQMGEDIVLTQELLWETKPIFVIETGISWGGCLAIYAAFQEIQEFGHVFRIDVTIPEHNRQTIMSTPVSKCITIIEVSSSDPVTFAKVSTQIPKGSNIPLVLDSNHTHEHVLAELNLWSPLLQPGNYIIVSDTIVEEMPEQKHRPCPWDPGNNPMTGMLEFLSQNERFDVRNSYSDTAFASLNPSGYLKCIK